MADTLPRPHRSDWPLVAALVTAAVLSYVNRQAPTLLVDPLRRDLGLGDVEVSYLIGASFAVIYAVSSLGFGWLADRASRTRIIAAAIMVWSVGSVACAFASGFWHLFACRMVIGASEAALIPAALSLIADHFAEERRGLATGTFLVGIFGGAGGAIIVVGYLLDMAGHGPLALLPYADVPWRQVFLLAGLPGLLLVPVFLLRSDRRGTSATATARRDPGAVTDMDWRPIALLCAALTLLAIADNAMLAWAPTLLIRDYGMEAAAVGRYLGLSLMLGGSAGVLAGGWLSDRLALRAGGRVLVCTLAAALAMLMPLPILGDAAWPVITGVGLYLAISASATCAGLSALLAATAPDRRGLVTSILTLLSVAVGFAVGPWLTVVLAGVLGGLGNGLISVSLSSLAAACLLFLLALLRVRVTPIQS